jgi:hypothetical protein
MWGWKRREGELSKRKRFTELAVGIPYLQLFSEHKARPHKI